MLVMFHVFIYSNVEHQGVIDDKCSHNLSIKLLYDLGRLGI